MNKPTLGYRIFSGFNIVFFILVSATMLLPFINVITLSLEPAHIASETGVLHLFPREITFDAYIEIWRQGQVPVSLMNSVFITVVGASLGVLVTGMLAYGLSNEKVMGVKLVSMLVLFTMMFHGGIIPSYMLVKNLGLIDSLWSLIIPSLITGYNVILMRVFFKGLPESLSESAMLDGCTEVGIFFRIVLPLSAPIIATVTLFYAVMKWNSFFQAIMFITDPKKKPLQVILREILTAATSGDAKDMSLDLGMNLKMATAVVAMAPILSVYPFLQKHFTKGILLGAVKG